MKFLLLTFYDLNQILKEKLVAGEGLEPPTSGL